MQGESLVATVPHHRPGGIVAHLRVQSLPILSILQSCSSVEVGRLDTEGPVAEMQGAGAGRHGYPAALLIGDNMDALPAKVAIPIAVEGPPPDEARPGQGRGHIGGKRDCHVV